MKLRSIQLCIGIASLSAVCALPATAQMNGHGAAAQSVNNPDQNNMGQSRDQDFLKSAYEGDMAEIAMSKVALEKSSNDDVKKFAQQMVDDHTSMSNSVLNAAKTLNVGLPNSPDKGAKKEIAKLQTLSGADFDKAYMEAMVKDHKKALSLFKSESSSTQNAGVRDIASAGTKTIQGHLEAAESLNAKVNAK